MAAARDETVVSRDGCVVETHQLAAVLDGFVRRWNRDRPPTAGKFAPNQTRTEVTTVTAYEWLAQETRLPERTIEQIARSRTRKNAPRLTELRVADALLTAIDCPEALHDGTLPVFENPLARPDARGEQQRVSQSLAGAVEPL